MENSVDKQAPRDTTLEMLVRWYESAEQSSMDARREAERDRDYRNGNQWTASELETLKKRKQPAITIDRIGPKVDYLLGVEQQYRADPKAYPRTPQDEQGAAAATDSIRFVLDDQRWDRVRSECFDQFIVEGACGADVRVVDKCGELCVEVKPIMWDRMFWDPHSRRRDFSDAKYKGQFLWMDVEEAEALWPDVVDAITTTLTTEASSDSDTYGDVPRLRWADPKRKRVRIAECWGFVGGKWHHYTYTKAGILEQMESPYQDDEGQSVDGFVFGSCYIDRDGNRFGVVRRWISLQDEINKRRSKALHLLNVRQVKYEKGAVDDVNAMRRELAKPDGAVEVTPGMMFDVLDTGDMAQAQLGLLQEAKTEIDAVGVNAAMAGTESRVMSGRALLARDEQGKTELGPVFDAFAQWQLDVYRAIWCRIKQFWTAEKWVRITDDDRNVRFVGLNQPITLGEQLLEEAERQGQEITPDMQYQAKMNPAMQRIVGTRNNMQNMDVDLILDMVPATATLQSEEFAALADLAGKGVPIPPDALIEASSLRGKDKILKKMRGEGEGKIPPQVQQVLEQAQAEIQGLQQRLQQAESGLQKATIDAQSRERVAQINAAASFDEATLNALADLLKAKIQPPPDLSAEVSGDLAAR